MTKEEQVHARADSARAAAKLIGEFLTPAEWIRDYAKPLLSIPDYYNRPVTTQRAMYGRRKNRNDYDG
jgi:hypothetical protein